LHIWRLCRKEFAAAPLAGEGGLRVAGRWHHKGHRIVYCAAHASLGVLEALVHFDPALAPVDLVLIEIAVPEDLAIPSVPRSKLPANWTVTPAPRQLQDLGSEWLTGGRSALLAVPSAIVPDESNVLVNPLHSDARRLRVVTKKPFAFDRRLLGS
jgi:RES domain-containing protein